MTAFPATIPDLAEVPREVRAAAVDSIVRENRRKTPPEVLNQRTVPRYSIAELNEADIDEVRDRFRRTRLDDRGPLTRFLDLIDLPRNVVGNIIGRTITPSKVKELERTGDVGAFGSTAVRTSDILDGLGVKNRIVRGVVGFIGDVATDPLTYVGPPGWGAKIVGTGGKAVTMTAKGRRLLKGAIAAASDGKAVRDSASRALLDAYGFSETAVQARLAAAADRAAEARKIRDEATERIVGQGRTNLNRALTPIGLADETRAGGGLADDVFGDLAADTAPDVAARIGAARSFVGQYGRQAAPGVRFGKMGKSRGVEVTGYGPGRFSSGTGYLHVPFTDLGVYGPELAGSGLTATAAAVNAGRSTLATDETRSPLTRGMQNFVSDHEALLQEARSIRRRQDDIAERLQTLRDRFDPLQSRRQQGVMTSGPAPSVASADPEEYGEWLRLENESQALGSLMQDVSARRAEVLQDWRNRMASLRGQSGADNAADVLHESRLAATLDARSRQAELEFRHYEAEKQGDLAKFWAIGKARQDAVDRRVGAAEAEIRKYNADLDAVHPEVPFSREDVRRNLERDVIAPLAGPGGPQSLRARRSENISRAELYRNLLRGDDDDLRQLFSVDPGEARFLVQGFDMPGRGVGLRADRLQAGDEWTVGAQTVRVTEIDPESGRVYLAVKEPDSVSGDLPDTAPGAIVTFGRTVEHSVPINSSFPLPANEGSFRRAGADFPKQYRSMTDDQRLTLAAQAVADWRKTLDLDSQRLADATVESMDAADEVARNLHERMHAAQITANLARGTLAQTASSDDVYLAALARVMNGFGEEDMGLEVHAPLNALVNGIFGDSDTARDITDVIEGGAARARTVWDRRSGSIHENARRLMRAQTDGGRGDEVLRAVSNTVMSALGRAGLSPDVAVGKMDDAMRLLYALTLRRADPLGTAFVRDIDPVYRVVEDSYRTLGIDPTTEAGRVFRESMEVAAADLQDKMRSMGLYERQVGVIDSLRGVYGLPNVPTAEASRAISLGKRQFGPGNQVMSATGAQEAFMKPRTTDIYVLRNKDGSVADYWFGYENELFPMYAQNENNLNLLDPLARQRVEEVLERIKQFNDPAEAAKAGVVADGVHPASPFLINERLRNDGYFKWLLNGQAPEQLFTENAAIAAAVRTNASERQYLREAWQEAVKPYQQIVQEAKLKRTDKIGDAVEFTTLGGAKGRVVRDTAGDANMVLEIGGERYRRLNPAVGGKSVFNPDMMMGTTERPAYTAWVPERIAEQWEQYLKATTPKDIPAVLQAYDGVLRAWKSVTLLHPSWYVMNVVGGLTQAMAAGVNPKAFARHAKDAAILAFRSHNAQQIGKMRLSIGGREYTGEELLAMVREYGLVQSGIYSEPLVEAIRDGKFYTPNAARMAARQDARLGRQSMTEVASELRKAVNEAGHGSLFQRIPGWKVLQQAKGLVIDEAVMNRLIKPWFAVNSKIDDAARVTAFMAFLESGDSASAAAAKVREALFDFNDLTGIERDWLRRLYPFYSWMRNSAAYGLRQLVQHPAYISIVPHLAHSIEQATAGEAALPEWQRPRWMRDQLAIQLGSDPETRSAVMIGSVLPQEAAMRFASGFASPLIGAEAAADVVSYLGQSASPLVRGIFELSSGREFFTDRQISVRPDEGDLNVFEYGVGQVRPLREWLYAGGVRTPAGVAAFERSPVEGATRLLVGGRAQPLSEERRLFALKRQYSEQVEAIRKRIRLAEREGAQEASVRARVRLLQVYQAMIRAGLEADVPKWARQQISQVSESPATSGAVAE